MPRKAVLRVKAPRKKAPKKTSTRKKSRVGRRTKMPRSVLSGLTSDGASFLKCAVAPWDFPGETCRGVPDEYSGKSFTLKHKFIYDYTLPTNGLASFAMLPVPATVFVAQPVSVTASMTYAPVKFPEFNSLFNGTATVSGTQLGNVSKFRVVNMSMRLKPTTSTLNNAGRVTWARLENVDMTQYGGGSASQVDNMALAGLYQASISDISSIPGSATEHINRGATAWSVNGKDTWEFSEVWNNISQVQAAEAAGTYVMASGTNYWYPGYGNMAPLVLTVSGSNNSTAVSIECTMTVEYVPTPGSTYMLLAGSSANHDPEALELYKEASRRLPVGVPADQNAGFWDHFLKIIGVLGGPIGSLFGPAGKFVGASIGSLATGLRSLIL